MNESGDQKYGKKGILSDIFNTSTNPFLLKRLLCVLPVLTRYLCVLSANPI
jgi:hypothetical protein